MATKKTRTFIVIDADGKPAARSIASLQREVDVLDADIEEVGTSGFSGLQKGAAGLADQFGHLAGPAAIGAIGAGLLKAVDHATDVAIEAGTIGSALDISVTEASRLNAAFGDVGIEANDLVDIALQINGALESDADLAKKLGVEVGQVLTPVEALERGIDNWDFLSASQRAASFGEEGVRQIARLASEGKTLEEILSGVSDSRLISEEDEEAAREYQAAMAKVQGAVEAIVIEMAQGFVPAMADALLLASEIVNVLSKDGPGNGFGLFDTLPEVLEKAGFHARVLGDAFLGIDFERPVERSTFLETKLGAVGRAGEAAFAQIRAGAEGAEEATDEATTALDRYKTQLDADSEWAQLQEAADRALDAATTAFLKGEDGAEDFWTAVQESEAATSDLITEIQKYNTNIDEIPEDVLTELVAAFEDQNLAEVDRILSEIQKPRVVPIIPKVTYLPNTNVIIDENGNVRPGAASVQQNTSNVTVNLGSSASMREVDQAVRRWATINGS